MKVYVNSYPLPIEAEIITEVAGRRLLVQTNGSRHIVRRSRCFGYTKDNIRRVAEMSKLYSEALEKHKRFMELEASLKRVRILKGELDGQENLQ